GRGSAAGRPPQYSRGTRELLKEMMDAMKLTYSQRRYLMNCVKRGEALPLQWPPLKSKESVPTSSPPACQPSKLPARPHLRPAKVCQAGGAYTREKFKPQPTRDLEKEKQRLQNILASGKDEVEDKVKQVLVQRKQEEMPEPDRFEELVNDIQDRREFLAQMKALGLDKEYQGIILTEISQKMHEMEIIDKKRTEEIRRITTKDFPGGNKSKLHN
ncbi:EVG1 protein, partial [Grallaria varia]|nr:EVG1 protein [Grallaria varia]